MLKEKQERRKKKFSLAALMEVIETELDVGDIFKFPISKGNYNLIKRYVRNSPKEIMKLIN